MTAGADPPRREAAADGRLQSSLRYTQYASVTCSHDTHGCNGAGIAPDVPCMQHQTTADLPHKDQHVRYYNAKSARRGADVRAGRSSETVARARKAQVVTPSASSWGRTAHASPAFWRLLTSCAVFIKLCVKSHLACLYAM